jgi:hypothetical protein
MTLNQYEKAHIALLAQIAKATERIADAIETFNATDPLQAIERALMDEIKTTPQDGADTYGSVAKELETMKKEYGADLPEDEKWRAR